MPTKLPTGPRTWIATFLMGALVALAWSPSRATQAAMPPPLAGNEAIEKAMHDMDGALKALGKGVTADNREASLEELSKLQSAILAAKSQVPSSAAKVDEKKRAAFVSDYRKTLVDALKFAADAEIAILDNKFKDADSLVRNKLGGLKSTGHGKFKTDGGK